MNIGRSWYLKTTSRLATSINRIVNKFNHTQLVYMLVIIPYQPLDQPLDQLSNVNRCWPLAITNQLLTSTNDQSWTIVSPLEHYRPDDSPTMNQDQPLHSQYVANILSILSIIYHHLLSMTQHHEASASTHRSPTVHPPFYPAPWHLTRLDTGAVRDQDRNSDSCTRRLGVASATRTSRANLWSDQGPFDHQRRVLTNEPKQ